MRPEVRVALLDQLWPQTPRLLREAGLQVVAEDEAPTVVVVRSGVRLDGDRLRALAARGLALVVRAGSGLENIDVQTANACGIQVRNIPGANAASVAEVTLGLALCLMHRLGEGALSMREGRFDKSRLVGRTIADLSIGFLGFGATGRAAARLFRALGARRLVAWSRSGARGERRDGVEMVDRETALSRQLLCLHLPLAPETRHLVGAATADLLAPGALVVDMSRREVVDGPLVARLIAEGRVAGYASDVLDPVADASLIALPQVVATPHLGAQTESAHRRVAETVLDLILRWRDERDAA